MRNRHSPYDGHTLAIIEKILTENQFRAVRIRVTVSYYIASRSHRLDREIPTSASCVFYNKYSIVTLLIFFIYLKIKSIHERI